MCIHLALAINKFKASVTAPNETIVYLILSCTDSDKMSKLSR